MTQIRENQWCLGRAVVWKRPESRGAGLWERSWRGHGTGSGTSIPSVTQIRHQKEKNSRFPRTRMGSVYAFGYGSGCVCLVHVGSGLFALVCVCDLYVFMCVHMRAHVGKCVHVCYACVHVRACVCICEYMWAVVCVYFACCVCVHICAYVSTHGQ